MLRNPLESGVALTPELALLNLLFCVNIVYILL